MISHRVSILLSFYIVCLLCELLKFVLVEPLGGIVYLHYLEYFDLFGLEKRWGVGGSVGASKVVAFCVVVFLLLSCNVLTG